MNKLIPIFFAISAFIAPSLMNAQKTCDSYEIALNKAVTAKDYATAYPMLNEALAACPNQKINFYNFGETILLDKIDKATNDADKKKFAGELVSLIEKRVKNFPDGKEAFWEGEKITYQMQHGLINKKAAYDAYTKLFGGSEDSQKISGSAVLNYFVASVELLNSEEIDYENAMKAYFQTKKVTEDNIEMRSVEYGELAEKLDSIQTVNPKKDLTPGEKQTMANAQSSKDVFVELSESMEHALAEITTCEHIAPMFAAKFEENKNNLEWIGGSYQALAAKDCYDLPFMEQLEDRYAVVWKKENPQATTVSSPVKGSQGSNVVASSYGAGARDFKAGNYSGAIANFQKAMDEVSGTTRGDVAYYIALSYQKTGSLTNAVSWAKKAANYKPGYGAPYQLIAAAFAASANSCGTSEFEKLSTYWVAADYANKACAVDSRSCSWAKSAVRSYEATAPNKELSFRAGKNTGDTVSISCLGGATTKVR